MSAKRKRDEPEAAASNQCDSSSTLSTPLRQSATKRVNRPFVPPRRVDPSASASKSATKSATKPSTRPPSAATPVTKPDAKKQATDLESHIRDILQSSCCQLFTSQLIKNQLVERSVAVSDQQIDAVLAKLVSDNEFVGCFALPADVKPDDSIIYLQPLIPSPSDLPQLSHVLDHPLSETSGQRPRSSPTDDLITPKKPGSTRANRPPSPSTERTPLAFNTPKSTNHLASSQLRAGVARRGPALLPASKLVTPLPSSSKQNPTRLSSGSPNPIVSSQSSALSPSADSIAALQAELTSINRSIAKLQSERLLNVDTSETSRLDALGDKWLNACQSALQDLLEGINKSGNDPVDMATLMRMMNLDHEQLQYSIEAEEFLESSTSKPKT